MEYKNKALSSYENSREIIEDAKSDLGITKNFTDQQLKYIELALLDNDAVSEISGMEVNNKTSRIKALCKLLSTSENVIYNYQNDIKINSILWKLGIESFSRILPAYLNQIEKGVLKGDKEALHHAKALTQKLIDVKEKKDIHLHQHNYLNVDGQGLNKLMNDLKKKHAEE